MTIQEDGCSVTSGEVSDFAPQNMRKLIMPLWERLESAKRRWSETSLQERVESAKERWSDTPRITNVSGIDTDYEKNRDKQINARIKNYSSDFEDQRNSQQAIDADLREADYVDGQVDEFLRDWLKDNQ
jgi:hypothetical protein